MDYNIAVGDYVNIMLADETIIEGDVVRVGEDHVVVDDVSAYGDWVFIEYENILDLRVV